MASLAQRLSTAVDHHQAGRLAEAEALYRGILQDSPRHARALHLLGLLAHQTGRTEIAIELIQQALAVYGPQPLFHNDLAAAYIAAGRPIEALGHCQEALRLQPDLADAHNNLGVALREQGRLDEAADAFREAVRLNPLHAAAQCNLGDVFQWQGKSHEARIHLQEAVRLAPHNTETLNNLGALLAACGEPQQAAEKLREALRLRPDFANAHSNLGVALEHLGRIDEALACFREALRLQPDYATAHTNLGAALQSQGKREEALAAFQAALRLDPNNTLAIFHLGKLAAVGHYRFSAAEIEHIHSLLARRSLPLDSRCRLHFALGQMYDRTGEYDLAFEHMQRASELRKDLYGQRGKVFSIRPVRELVDRLIATFIPAFFERVNAWGVPSEVPIFIVGMPRSGTTLAEQILASHPQVHGAGELLEIDRLVAALPGRLGTTEPYPACLAQLDAAAAQALGAAHVEHLRQLGGTEARVVDKMPSNFFHLGLIATLLPRAHIVHCRRDPTDTCLSCFFQNFADHSPFTLDLQHLGQYYREYQRLMAHWAAVLPVPIFELSYEQLTADQEAGSRRLVEFCGLDWDERCLRFYDNARVVQTFSSLQVRQPMYRRSVNRWKHYEKHLQPLLEELER